MCATTGAPAPAFAFVEDAGVDDVEVVTVALAEAGAGADAVVVVDVEGSVAAWDDDDDDASGSVLPCSSVARPVPLLRDEGLEDMMMFEKDLRKKIRRADDVLCMRRMRGR